MIDSVTLMTLVAKAVLAPSGHNTQPWLFLVRGNAIELHADRSRALPVNDPHDRELIISCGCALLNLRVAAAHHGLHTEVELLPDPAQPDWLARVSFTASTDALPDAQLYEAIDLRRTYRKAFAFERVRAETLDALSTAARWEGAWLEVLASDTQRQDTAALVADADKQLWGNPSWRRELAMWMHPRRSGDGISLPGYEVPFAQLVMRTFDLGNGQAAKDKQIADESPVLAVLGTEGDNDTQWLAAGQALQRVLLVAATRHLQASYLNQPIELPETRQRLAVLIGKSDQHPQVLMRLGIPQQEVAAAPRRPLADVLIELT